MVMEVVNGSVIQPRDVGRQAVQFHAAPNADGGGWVVSVMFATEPHHGNYTVPNVDAVAKLLRELRWRS
jgi:hypothetical protein